MTKIIAGFGGVGKTMLAKKYKNVLDLESTPYKYLIENYEKYDAEAVKGQSIAKKELNPDFPHNYVAAVKENIGKYDYILVWAHPEQSLPHLDKAGIDYEIFLPTREALDEYRQRFINRGNSEEYVNRVSSKEGYDKRLLQWKALNKPIVYLEAGETLESYLLAHKEYPKLSPRDISLLNLKKSKADIER
ncbi:MAG: hypothetical protein IJS26_04740 [Alphaproteobacteria bacterium]|nr:hypothetical protein [Alphaproteobacteria bacterium]